MAFSPRLTRHTFTTEAVAVDGSQAREEVVLRVPQVKRQPHLPYDIWASPSAARPGLGPRRDLARVLWIGAPTRERDGV